MKYITILSLFFMFFESSIVHAQRIKTVSVELIEEKYNGKFFSYRIDVINGVKKEQWIISGKATDRDTYESELLFQKLEEEKNKREKEYQERITRFELQQQQRVALSKKLLKKEINAVQHKFDQFKKYDLNEYYAFNSQTIASEIDFLNIPAQCIIPAKTYLQKDDDDFLVEKAEEYSETLQIYFNKLTCLFDDSVKKAIDQCEDTQKLKDLLVIVS
ncbi:hypothetical protein K9K77_02665 [Candidatus Babeliales bacterium]|nr:hypothetical protein [Candidatus Babeliales bacterium]